MATPVKKSSSKTQWYELPDNYIYISHLGEDGEYIILPNYPEAVSDSMGSTFSETTALSRSAPVYTYSNSGPRSMQFSFLLHRDMMDSVNEGKSNVIPEDGDDYIETFIKKIQAIAVPEYNLSNKAVEPPTVAVRICNEVFIRGIVSGGVTVAFMKPILSNGKYAQVTVGFTVYETDPYDATTIAKNGSFRGVTRGMKDGFNLEGDNL